MSELPAEPAGIELAPGVRVEPAAVRVRFVRSSGPGGQNVNKVSTACELRMSMAVLEPHLRPSAFARMRSLLGSRLTDAGEIVIVGDEHRTQERNRTAVLDRLRQLIVAAMVEPKPRKKTKPTRAAKLRRLEGKRRRSDIKAGRRMRGGD